MTLKGDRLPTFLTEEELNEAYPWIPWREPVTIGTPTARAFGCRICIV
jgi:hypothetical protein